MNKPKLVENSWTVMVKALAEIRNVASPYQDMGDVKSKALHRVHELAKTALHEIARIENGKQAAEVEL